MSPRHEGRGRKKLPEGDSSDDDEYRKKRDRNNLVSYQFMDDVVVIITQVQCVTLILIAQAVKKSRVKSRMRTQETMERVEQLKRENDQLEEKIKLLSKELGFLKELFIAHAGLYKMIKVL